MGRYRPGEEHPRARLTEEKVRAIRALAASGATNAALAREFGVARQHISDIVRGRCWAHVGPDRDRRQP